jgi:hypothetical protein
MKYKLIASVLDNNGVRINATQPEVLGEFYGMEFASREAAEAAAETAAEEAAEFYQDVEVLVVED